MVLAGILLLVSGYVLLYTGFKPPNGNPYDLWYWFREAFAAEAKHGK